MPLLENYLEDISTAYDTETLNKRDFDSMWNGSDVNEVMIRIDENLDLVDQVISDERGTVLGMLRGNELDKYTYSASGLRKNLVGSGNFEFGYTGMFIEPFTGLLHTHFRDYDVRLGRWDREDPAGYVDGLNLYAGYFGVNGVDALGLTIRVSKGQQASINYFFGSDVGYKKSGDSYDVVLGENSLTYLQGYQGDKLFKELLASASTSTESYTLKDIQSIHSFLTKSKSSVKKEAVGLGPLGGIVWMDKSNVKNYWKKSKLTQGFRTNNAIVDQLFTGYMMGFGIASAPVVIFVAVEAGPASIAMAKLSVDVARLGLTGLRVSSIMLKNGRVIFKITVARGAGKLLTTESMYVKFTLGLITGYLKGGYGKGTPNIQNLSTAQDMGARLGELIAKAVDLGGKLHLDKYIKQFF